MAKLNLDNVRRTLKIQDGKMVETVTTISPDGEFARQDVATLSDNEVAKRRQVFVQIEKPIPHGRGLGEWFICKFYKISQFAIFFCFLFCFFQNLC